MTLTEGDDPSEAAIRIIHNKKQNPQSANDLPTQTREQALLAFTLSVKRMICCCNSKDDPAKGVASFILCGCEKGAKEFRDGADLRLKGI
ncbi:hypothetical protein Tco_1141685 [Tanacetum coccineum]